MKQELVKKHAYRVCYSHEYIGDGIKYPYTYESQEEQKNKEIQGQMSLFDFMEDKR